MRLAPYAYVTALALLAAVQAFGTEVNGAKSWLYLGPLPGFQPSEMAKLAFLVALAAALHDRPIRRLVGLPAAAGSRRGAHGARAR